MDDRQLQHAHVKDTPCFKARLSRNWTTTQARCPSWTQGEFGHGPSHSDLQVERKRVPEGQKLIIRFGSWPEHARAGCKTNPLARWLCFSWSYATYIQKSFWQMVVFLEVVLAVVCHLGIPILNSLANHGHKPWLEPTERGRAIRSKKSMCRPGDQSESQRRSES